MILMQMMTLMIDMIIMMMMMLNIVYDDENDNDFDNGGDYNNVDYVDQDSNDDVCETTWTLCDDKQYSMTVHKQCHCHYTRSFRLICISPYNVNIDPTCLTFEFREQIICIQLYEHNSSR